MARQPTFVDRPLDTGAELLCRAAGHYEGSVDQLDVDQAVLGRLGGVGDFQELARGGADQVRPLIARHAKIRIQAPMKPAMR